VLTRSFEATVSALADALIREHGGTDPGPLRDGVVRFVLAQHGRMPDHLRLPLVVLTCGFDWLALATAGAPFHRLSPDRRRRRVRAWRTARLGVCRDLVRFWETLVVFGWTALGSEPG
jgi:hypothetical protein